MPDYVPAWRQLVKVLGSTATAFVPPVSAALDRLLSVENRGQLPAVVLFSSFTYVLRV